MIIKIAHIEIHPEFTESFEKETLNNRRESLKESGVHKFDFLKKSKTNNQYTIYEAYFDEAAIQSHKATAHYKSWCENAEPMMAFPRETISHSIIEADF